MQACRTLSLTLVLLLASVAIGALMACRGAPTPGGREGPPPPAARVRLSPSLAVVPQTANPPAIPELPVVLGRVSLNEAFPSAPRALDVDPRNGDVMVVGGGDHGQPGWLAVVRGDAIAGTVQLGGAPRAVAVHPSTGHAYVVDGANDQVVVVSGTGVVATVPVGHLPTDVAIDARTGYVYVSNTQRAAAASEEIGTVSILSGTEMLKTVRAGVAPQQIAVHPRNHLVYVRNHRDSITVLRDGEAVADVPAALPWSLGAMAVVPGTGYVYIASGDSVVVIDGMEVILVLDLDGPAIDALAADPSTGQVYAAHRQGVAVIDELRVATTLPLEQLPVGLACHPNTGTCTLASLLDMGDTALTVLRGGEIVTSTWAGSYPYALAADARGERMYLASDGLVALVGAQVEASVGAPLGITAGAASAGTVYLAARSPRQSGDRILVVRELKTVASVPTAGSVAAMTVNPATGLAYVVDSRHAQVLVLSGAEVIGRVEVGPGPNSVTASPDNGLVYVVNAGGPVPGTGAVDVVSGTQWLGRVPVGDSPGEAIVEPHSGSVYVANRGLPPEYAGSVDVIRGLERVATLPAGRYPHALVADPATGTVYAFNRDSNEVTVYQELALVATLPLSSSPLDACLAPEPGLVYVVEEGDRVAVLSGTQVLAEVPVAPRARLVAADARSGYVYVMGEKSASGDSHLTVLRGTDVLSTLQFPGRALSTLVAEPGTGHVYLFEELEDDLLVVGPETPGTGGKGVLP